MIDYAAEFPWLDSEQWSEWRAYRNANRKWGPLTERAERTALKHLELVFGTPEARRDRIDYAMVQGWRGLVWPNELQAARPKKAAPPQAGSQPRKPGACFRCGRSDTPRTRIGRSWNYACTPNCEQWNAESQPEGSTAS